MVGVDIYNWNLCFGTGTKFKTFEKSGVFFIFMDMRKDKIILFEEVYRIMEISDISGMRGKDLIVVDIQPEYMDGITFLSSFIKFLNLHFDEFNSVTFLYNGYDTLGMINEGDYMLWWIENGLDEEKVYDIEFYDKGHAFFRYCIDSSIDDEVTTNLVRMMIEKGINDSRDLDESFWDEFIERYGDGDVRELLEFADDCINIPDLMDFLGRYNNIVLVGGGINECLKEVEIALNALEKPYTTIPKYLY